MKIAVENLQNDTFYIDLVGCSVCKIYHCYVPKFNKNIFLEY